MDTNENKWDSIIADAADLSEDDALATLAPAAVPEPKTEPADGHPLDVSQPVTEPVTLPKFSEASPSLSEYPQRGIDVQPPRPLADVGIAHHQAAVEAITQAHASKVEDAPVSQSADPIKLVEDPPAPQVSEMRRMVVGNVEIIATPERIQFLELNGVRPSEPAPPPEPPRITARVLSQTIAEQNAGKLALERHAAHIVTVPRAKPTEKELMAEGKCVPVFRPNESPLAGMLNKPAVPGKGGGY